MRRRGSALAVPALATGLARDRSLVSQREVLALITIRVRIGSHGFPTDIVGGRFCGGMHGSKLTLLILDLVLQLLDRARAKLASCLGTALWRILPT